MDSSSSPREDGGLLFSLLCGIRGRSLEAASGAPLLGVLPGAGILRLGFLLPWAKSGSGRRPAAPHRETSSPQEPAGPALRFPGSEGTPAEAPSVLLSHSRLT